MAIQTTILELESHFDLVTGLHVSEFSETDFEVAISGFQSDGASAADRRHDVERDVIILVVTVVVVQKFATDIMI